MTRRVFIKRAVLYTVGAVVLVGAYLLITRYGAFFQTKSTPATTSTTKVRPLNADSLLFYSNQERTKAKIAPLTISTYLNQSATAKVEDMAKEKYYDHENPTTKRPGYTYIYDFMPEVCQYVGENLYQFKDAHDKTDVDYAKQVIDTWMASRENQNEAILDPDYTLVGFGVKDKYVVQHFCQLKK